MKRKIDISIVSDDVCLTGEMPIWDASEQMLYWIDTQGEKIYRLADDGKVSSWKPPRRVGALAFQADDGLMATMRDGIYSIVLSGDGATSQCSTEPLMRPQLPDGVRLKEGKVDPAGRYWFGSTGEDPKAKQGSLFRLDGAGGVKKFDDGFMVINGGAFSPDHRTMLVADSTNDTVYAYDFDLKSGGVSNRRQFFSTAEFPGYIDGANFDSEGGYWCAMIHGWAIARIDPKGRLDRLVQLPVKYPTMCAFGGPNLDVMYVTTASSFFKKGEGALQPHAGKLFAIRGLGPNGVPEFKFGSQI